MTYPIERNCKDCGKPYLIRYKPKAGSISYLCEDCRLKHMRKSQYKSIKKRQQVYSLAILFIEGEGLKEKFIEYLKEKKDIDPGRIFTYPNYVRL